MAACNNCNNATCIFFVFSDLTIHACSSLADAQTKLTPDSYIAFKEARTAALKALPSPLEFWDTQRRNQFPVLAAALPYVVPTPATSVACESLFSHLDLVLAKRRQRLSTESLATLCILHFERWSLVDYKLHVAERERAIAAANTVHIVD